MNPIIPMRTLKFKVKKNQLFGFQFPQPTFSTFNISHIDPLRFEVRILCGTHFLKDFIKICENSEPDLDWNSKFQNFLLYFPKQLRHPTRDWSLAESFGGTKKETFCRLLCISSLSSHFLCFTLEIAKFAKKCLEIYVLPWHTWKLALILSTLCIHIDNLLEFLLLRSIQQVEVWNRPDVAGDWKIDPIFDEKESKLVTIYTKNFPNYC